jgi:hypothetical protein
MALTDNDVTRAVTAWMAKLPDGTATVARAAHAARVVRAASARAGTASAQLATAAWTSGTPYARTAGAWALQLPHAKPRALVLALLIVCLGATPVSISMLDGAQSAAQATDLESSVTKTLPDRSGRAASRSQTREALGEAPGEAPAGVGSSASGKRKATTPAKPRPVAGLTQVQMDHAKTIVAVGERLKMPKRAYVIAVATAMQETNLRNLANPALPSSLYIKNDGTGFDHDSVGLFQQRPASGWGAVNELMYPSIAAFKFYQALARVPGWDRMPLTWAAQSVQGSAFPDAYAKHEGRANAVVNALAK